MTMDDDQFIHDIFNDVDVMRFVGRRGIDCLENARKYIAVVLDSYKNNGYGMYVGCLKDATHTPISIMGLVKRPWVDFDDEVNLGFSILKQYSGQKYTLESAKATLDYGRQTLKLNRVIGTANILNVASVEILKKVGLTLKRTYTETHDNETNTYCTTTPPRTPASLPKSTTPMSMILKNIPVTSNTIKDESGFQTYLSTLNNVIIAYTDNERPLENPEEIIVDVTPSKNILLKAGTSEYNLPNAIAEFIDNSIQAVRGNPFGDKVIHINIKKPSSDGFTTITFWDNGCGMSKDDLQRWATMGMSQADIAKDSNRLKDMDSKTTTGLISRFGVGAKKAAFYLGSEVVVVTKKATSTEAGHQQFTEVTINNVAMSLEAFDETLKNVRRDLAHIYYYYLNEDPAKSLRYDTATTPTPNTSQSSQRVKKQRQDSDDDSDDEQAAQGRKSLEQKDYHIAMNGKDLSEVRDSMENLYISKGKKFRVLELKVDTGGGESSTVICHMRYFPFEDERETLPIPDRIIREHSADEVENLPLTLRKPGFEIFWNGRLISEAHIERLSFMSTGRVDGEKLEERWVQRVKGALFLGSSFPVTHNKMHIIKEHPVFANLEKSGSRQQGSDWKKWLLKCHKLDQDFQFEGAKYDTSTGKTTVKILSVGGNTYTRDDHVLIGTRPSTYGTLKNIFFSGPIDMRTSDVQLEIDRLYHKPLATEVYPASKLKSKIRPLDYQKLQENVKSKLPGKIKIAEIDGVPLPKTTYIAGEKIPWITILLLDKQHPPKEMEKKMIDAENLKVVFTVTYENGEVINRVEGEKYYQPGRISYGPLDLFKRTGSYTFNFACNYPGVTPATHPVKVVAGQVSKMTGTFILNKSKPTTTVTRYPLESTLPPISLRLIDEQNNVAPVTNIPPTSALSITAELLEEPSASQQDNNSKIVFANGYKVTLDNGSMIITGLSVSRAGLGEESEGDVVISVKYLDLECELEPLRMVAGPPVEMVFTPPEIFDTEYMNLTLVPPFTVFLKDASGNLCRSPGALDLPTGAKKKRRTGPAMRESSDSDYILAISSVLKEDIHVNADNDDISYNFAETKQLFIEEDTKLEPEVATGKVAPKSTSKVSLQFSLYRDKREFLTSEKTLIILPSAKPAYLKLCQLSEASMIMIKEDNFKALAGSSLSFGAKVFSAGGGGRGPFELSGLKVTVDTSWDLNANKNLELNSANMLVLPPLITDKVTRGSIYSVTATIAWPTAFKLADRTITLKKDFTVQTTGGSPSSFFAVFARGVAPEKIRCDSETTIELKLHDKRGNTVTPDDMRSGGIIDPYFVLSSDDPNNQMPFSIKSSTILPFNKDKNMYPCKLVLIGFGNLTITVKDRNNLITEYPLKLNIIEVPCARGEYTDEIMVSVCDTLGNTVQALNGVEIQLEWINLVGDPPFAIKSKTVISHGLATIKNMDIVGAEGSYEMRVSTKNVSTTPATITFIVKGSASIFLHNQLPLLFKPGSSFVPRVSVLNTERQPLAMPKENIKLTFHMKTIDATRTEEDGAVYLFDDIRVPVKATDYPLKFTFSTGGSNNRAELLTSFTVIPDEPSKLNHIGKTQEDTSSTIGRDITIFVTDSYDNRVAIQKAQVSVSIEQSRQTESQVMLPSLVGDKMVPLNDNGEAFFPLISLKESVGVSGPYKLVFSTTYKGKPIRHEVEFFYRNSREDLDKKVEMQKQRVHLTKQQQALENERVEKNQEIEVINGQREQHKVSVQRMEEVLGRFIPNFATSPAAKDPEALKKLLNDTEADINRLKNRPRRPATLPTNPISKEMSELSRSQGEEVSGIIGLVSEIIFVDNEIEAQLIAKLIGKKLEFVIVTNKDKLDMYYKRYRDSRYSIGFLAQTLMAPFTDPQHHHSSQGHHNNQHLPVSLLNGAPTRGFVGHAVNRIQFRAKHESLRRTLGWTLLRDALIFEKLSDGWDYRTYVVAQRRQCPPILCLAEAEMIEASGVLVVGKKEIQRDFGTIGQLPISESREFNDCNEKRRLLADFKSIKHQSYVYRKTYDSLLNDAINRSKQLDQEIREVKQEIDKLMAQLSKLDPEMAYSSSSSSSSSSQGSNMGNNTNRNRDPRRR
eukprot:gene3680-4235_t